MHPTFWLDDTATVGVLRAVILWYLKKTKFIFLFCKLFAFETVGETLMHSRLDINGFRL